MSLAVSLGFHDDLFGGTRISSAVHQGRGPWSAARRWTDFHDDLFGGTRISSAVHQGRGPWSAARRWTDFHSRRRPRGGLAPGHVRFGDQGSLILVNAAQAAYAVPSRKTDPRLPRGRSA